MILICEKTGRYWRLRRGENWRSRACTLGLKDYTVEGGRA